MFASLPAGGRERLARLQAQLLLLVLLAIFAVKAPHFLGSGNFSNIFNASSVIGMMAIGATFVIAFGGIDLSSAGVMALSGTACAWLLQASWPPAVAIPLGAGLGGVFGLMTGCLINITGAPSFIVSLGMMSIARAIAYILSHGAAIYGLPDGMTA